MSRDYSIWQTVPSIDYFVYKKSISLNHNDICG